MDEAGALEVVAKPATVHPSPKTSSRPSDVRVFNQRAAQNDQAFPSRTSLIRVNALVSKSAGSSSLHALSRNPSPSSQTSSSHLYGAHDSTLKRSNDGISRGVISGAESAPKRPNDGISPGAIAGAESKRQTREPISQDVPSRCNLVTAESANETKQLVVRDKPTLQGNFSNLSPKAKLKIVKQFINAFEYKQTPATHFNTHKLRPLSRIMDTARMIIYSPQPIKCVEAVFLALYLTAGISDCDRIPLSFKTSVGGQVYQHIVLLVRYGSKFGAFGISRHPDLMTKDITFTSVSEVIGNYKKAYEAASHLVMKIRVGLLVEHNVNSPHFVCWRHLSLYPCVQSWEQCCGALESHQLKQSRLWDLWVLTGKGGDPRRKTLARKAALDTKLLGHELKRKKKVKTQDSTILLMGAKQVVNRPPRQDFKGTSAQGSIVEARAKAEKKHDARLSATKSLIKVRILNSKASNFIRLGAQRMNPELSTRCLLSRGLLSSAQGRRLARISLNLDRGEHYSIGRSSHEQAKHATSVGFKGKQQESLIDVLDSRG